MTFKQKLKIVNLIFVIIAAIALFLPNVKDDKESYNLFKLISLNGFKFLIVLILVLLIITITTSLMQISYDANKIIPIITLACAFISGILEVLIRRLAAPSGKTFWLDYSKLEFGAYMLFISMFISFILNLIITIRSFVFDKNDDEYLENDIEETVDTMYNDSTVTTETEDYLLDEFDNK